MDSGMPVSKEELRALLRALTNSQLLNRQLSSICAVNGLKTTGVKAELQGRITAAIQQAYNTGDFSRFRQIEQSVANVTPLTIVSATSQSQTSFSPTQSTNAASSHTMPSYNHNQGYQYGSIGAKPSAADFPSPRPYANGHPYQTGVPPPYFNDSPFYEIVSRLGEVRACEVMPAHRNTVTIPIKLHDNPALQQCVNDKSMRIMVFCAVDDKGTQEISFPHQSEIKVNGGDVKANLRGVKGKPGTTRPVDITDHLRLRPNYGNNVDFTYALTTKKYFLVLSICKIYTVESLVTKIQHGKRIPKDAVIQEIKGKAEDSEIVATSTVLSLKCPISYGRLSLPCRASSCTHIQCFDINSYLQLQQQSPQWLCPICNKPAGFDNLAVDEYVKDILANTNSSVDQVVIEPDGRWSTQAAPSKPEPQEQAEEFFDDDFEISEINVLNGRAFETPNRSLPCISTPVTATSREGSSMPPRTSSKRQVIDLTLSSDEDDEPIARPAKRQQTAMNSFSDPFDPKFY